jgi:hypothetical protein
MRCNQASATQVSGDHFGTRLTYVRLQRLHLIHTHITDAFVGGGHVGDFAVEIGSELSYFASSITGRLHQRAPTKRSFGRAFGVEGYAQVQGELRSNVYATTHASRTSYDEDIRLAPYKASALDMSRVDSPEDVDTYSREESTLAA